MMMVAALVVAFAGCDKADNDGKMVFTVGFDAEFPPYGYKVGKEYKGFDLDLAREVCRRRDWTFKPNPINWDAKDMELDSGSISCIWNGFTMQGREDAYAWSEPYIDNSQMILVKADAKIASFADLAGKTVGAQTDTPVLKVLSGKDEKQAAAAALGKTFKKIVVSSNYNQLVMDLESGAVDAVALDVGVALKKMSDMPGKFKMLDKSVMKETYGVGFRKDNTRLRDLVQATLKEMVADGTMARIAAEYKIESNALILKP